MKKIKVAIAQINFRPAYVFSNIDATIEPNIKETTISQLSYNGSSKLKEELKKEYITWIRNKTIAIVKCANRNNVDLLVFPEYSIPPDILCDIVTALKDSKMFVVAGTHMVTNRKMDLPQNYPSVKHILRFALCPVLSTNGIVGYTFKQHKAQPEICSLRTPSEKVNDVIDLGEFKIQIKICIDAITNTEVFAFNKDNKGILVIPSYSYTVDPFNAVATYLRFNEIPVLYSNFGDIGGSVISASFAKSDKHWFLDNMKSKSLSKEVEAIVTATFDLDKMFTPNGTVNTEVGAVLNDVICILYSKNNNHKIVLSAIDKYVKSLDEDDLFSLKNVLTTSLMAYKLRYVEQMQKIGLIDSECAENIFKYVSVNDITYNQLYSNQCIKIFNSLTSAGQFISKDEHILPNIQLISGYYAKINSGDTGVSQNENILEDERLFYGRDLEIAALSDFFYSSNKVILVHGLRGIGKTKLVKNIESQIIPLKSLWEINYIQISQGIGLELFLDELSNILGLPYVDFTKLNIDAISEKLFNAINSGKERIFILDDIHHCTDSNGNFVDSVFGDFFCKFINKTKCSNKLKLVLVSNRKIIDIDNIVNEKLEVSRLKDLYIKNIINYCYQKISGCPLSSISIPPKIYKIIYGNPLAAILISQLIIENKWNKFEETADVFNHFQERLIRNLLDEIELSDDESKLLEIMSVTKGKLDIRFIKEKYAYLLSSVDSLINRFLLESDGLSLVIHPLFKEHYYNFISVTGRIHYHKIIADYYEEIVLHYQENKKNLPPNILANTIFHLGGSLQLNKFAYYKNKYIEELKPIADAFYKDQEHKKALVYYRKIFDTVGITRTDILIRMAQCCVYENNISDADKFFDLALKQNPTSVYIWANYAIALTSKKEYVDKALSCIKAAEEIESKTYILPWQSAKIKFAKARAYRYSDINNAANLYLEACDIEKTNSYYLCVCADFLYKYVDKQLAIEKLKLAEKLEPTYHFVARLKNKFALYLNKESEEVESEEVESEEVESEEVESEEVESEEVESEEVESEEVGSEEVGSEEVDFQKSKDDMELLAGIL